MLFKLQRVLREFSISNIKLDIFVTSNIDSLIQMFDVN